MFILKTIITKYLLNLTKYVALLSSNEKNTDPSYSCFYHNLIIDTSVNFKNGKFCYIIEICLM